jgi:hypothetical protein
MAINVHSYTILDRTLTGLLNRTYADNDTSIVSSLINEIPMERVAGTLHRFRFQVKHHLSMFNVSSINSSFKSILNVNSKKAYIISIFIIV